MKIDKVILIVFGALIAVGAGAALFSASRVSSPPPIQAAAVSPKPAPDFKLEVFSGKTIALKDFAGKEPVVINFWASWCPPCREEAPVLAKVSRAYAGKVEFIGIVTKDSQANAMAFMKEFGISYDNGIDQDNIYGKYGLTGIPETFWIDKEGQIVGHWIGAIDEASLTSQTQRLLQ